MTEATHTVWVVCEADGFPRLLSLILLAQRKRQFKLRMLINRYQVNHHQPSRRDLRTGANPPHMVINEAQLCSEISDRHGSATGRRHEWSSGPAVRVWDAARLRELVQSRRWRSGLVRPSDPARGCLDRLAGLAAHRATPCSVTPLRAG